MKNKNEELTFKDILGVFIPKIWFILAAAVVVAVALAVYSAFMVDDSYTSSSVMHVRKDSESISVLDMELAEGVIDVVRYRVNSDAFLNKVIANVNENYGNTYETLLPAQIRGLISYSSLGNGMLKISVTSGNPQLSYAVAQSLEDLIPIEFYDYLPGVFNVLTYDNAKRPAAPNGKGTVRNALIGFVGGAVVAAIAVWIYASLSITVRDKKKLEDTFDIPIIGLIPVNETKTLTSEVKSDV